ncbi:flavin reductase family protein [Xanthomonas campestris pv. raphani]|uniref:flavin reductase family protein n=1 Tax=Xanthomonas campestris TaxID=339 RepID=UPI002B23B52E|nr:flavin reductase family protein [Xanthomonas campestris]MEA9747437.1 flavin reductase family protein [Xanthomonas campestris pv. raphani]MEA9847924.1 flavin reductase family protein [Xanthomonas campestris pv. raphani]MEA9929334.1 flavin reductase family protein [Xanthomonas campestris pv. raphani]
MNQPADTFHFYEPANGHGLPHDPFNAIVGPRPIGWIGWIGSRSADGIVNLAPYSFFNAFNYTPPIVGFASIGWKDSVRNIEATGVFTWNLATRPLAEAMNASAALVPPEVDEFELAGLQAAPSRLIDVPRVAASPVSFECRLSQLIPLQAADGRPIQTWLVLGEVVGVHLAHAALSDGIYDPAAVHTILRAGGPADYFEVQAQARFRMRRPGQ